MNRRVIPVSVVVPCYRCVATIARAVESVARQTTLPMEVILIDDCSGDETVGELRRLERLYAEGWIRVVELAANGGAGVARNTGWNLAVGRYVAFLDADDSWHPKKLEAQFAWMDHRPDVALTGHACAVSHEPTSSSGVGHEEFRQVTPCRLLTSNRFLTPSVMVRRSVLHRFDEGKRYSEDYLLWLTLCLDGHKCFRSPQILAFLHKPPYGHSGLSGNLARMELGELHAYLVLAKTGRIRLTVLPLVLAFSLLKFAKRVLGVGITRVIKRSPR